VGCGQCLSHNKLLSKSALTKNSAESTLEVVGDIFQFRDFIVFTCHDSRFPVLPLVDIYLGIFFHYRG